MADEARYDPRLQRRTLAAFNYLNSLPIEEQLAISRERMAAFREGQRVSAVEAANAHRNR